MALVTIAMGLWLGLAWADGPPAQCRLPDLPVHDQDGVGMCASSTASLLMQHNLGLANAPSALALSITHSGIDGEEADAFFFTKTENGKSEERLFNWGAITCKVIDTAKEEGFCDYQRFGFDFIGSSDPLGSQQSLLMGMARFLAGRESDIRSLREDLRDPAKRGAATQRLAFFFADRDRQCANTNARDFIARRMLERRVAGWRHHLAGTTNPTQQRTLRRLIRETVNEDGSFKAAPLDYLSTFLESDLVPMLERHQQDGSVPLVKSEDLFTTWWGLRFDLNTSFLPYSTTNNAAHYISDFRAYGPCRENESSYALRGYLNAPLCMVPPDAPLQDEHVRQARDLIGTLSRMAEGSLDMQASIVNILSPSCAAEMVARRGSFSADCEENSIEGSSSSRRARERTLQHLCQGRAVGLSICTGFFVATTPVDSSFCEDTTLQGVANHGKHAVTVVGQRMMNDKRQFLVQNSWGRSCPFMQHPDNQVPTALRPLVECELGADGRPSGRFWVEEQLLFNNSFRYSTLTRD